MESTCLERAKTVTAYGTGIRDYTFAETPEGVILSGISGGQLKPVTDPADLEIAKKILWPGK